MSGKTFVETNILVYSRDSSEPDKQAVALKWLSVLWQQRSGRISVQTWLIQDQYEFSWWDSLIISAAQVQDCR